MTITDEILKNRPDQVLRLIQNGENVNGVDIYGFTPLSEAAIANNADIAKLLLEQGADVKAHDVMGSTALHWAVENNNLRLAKLLLEAGADPNAYSKNAQPVLVQPLLRRQQPLKELLYQHGADLKFAQDYINAKLISHRFELSGKVDIVDHQGTFLEMSCEGFVLEFTLNIIQESLQQFRNSFAARNLRDYKNDQQVIIESFALASELVKYQHHLVNIQQHRTRLQKLSQSPLLLLPVGYEGHAITFAKCGDLFVKCDRGANSLHHPSVEIFTIGKPQLFDARFLEYLLYQRQESEFLTTGIVEVLQLETVGTLPLPSQLTGNCSWANVEASVPALLMLWWSGGNAQILQRQFLSYRVEAMAIYQQWLEWDKDWALHQCVESFYDAQPARRAAKAAILAAVLVQSCRYLNANDRSRANKILAVLATPEYEYILRSYLKVYQKTSAGHNLKELIDVYGQGQQL